MDLIERIPVFGKDYTTDNFAQEAALKDYISFNKGCYIGQEPNARLFFGGAHKISLLVYQFQIQQTFMMHHPCFLEAS